MLDKLTSLTPDQWKSTIRSIGLVLGGALMMLGTVSLAQKDQIVATFTQLANHWDTIMAGASALSSAALALWGVINSSKASKIASVASMPDQIVVKIDPAHQTEAALKVATLPEVKAVITTPAVAAATPQVTKIVAPNQELPHA